MLLCVRLLLATFHVFLSLEVDNHLLLPLLAQVRMDMFLLLSLPLKILLLALPFTFRLMALSLKFLLMALSLKFLLLVTPHPRQQPWPAYSIFLPAGTRSS
jgi:hypothetical protein